MKVEEIDIPDEWTTMLLDLRIRDSKAIIAGGAIRDLFCGHQPKDLDFFTSVVPNWPNQQEAEMDYEGMQYVQGVISYNKQGPIPINVVIVEPIENMALLESFDFGLCQIGFDNTNILKTQAFDWDFKHSLFTLRHIDRYPRSIRRYARINQRYDLDIAIPQLDKEP